MSKFPLSLGHGGGQVVSVLAYYMMIQIRIPQTSTVLSVKFVFKKNQNEQKEAGISPFLKTPPLFWGAYWQISIIPGKVGFILCHTYKRS